MPRFDFVRIPWQANFPAVVVHAALSSRDSHPSFAAAKAGDFSSAIRLARDLAFGEDGGWELLGDLAADMVVLPVSAIESHGFNAIPDAFASVCANALGLPVRSGWIIQSNRVGHTRSNGWHRLVTPPAFEERVDTNRDYILVDDHVGFGGTLANLRGYVESRGGRVVAMTALTETPEAHVIAIRPETLSMLHSRHGQLLHELWLASFGYGLDCLTNIEGGYLARQPSVDVIRKRMAEAAEQARGRGFPAVALDGGG